MKTNKRKSRALITIFAIICLIFQPIYVTTDNPLKLNSQGELRSAAVISGTKQWLNNTNFDAPIDPWYNESLGDTTDVNVSLSNGIANFIVEGDQKVFNNISGAPKNGEWIPGNESEISINPDNYEIDNYGCWADHEYREGTGYDQSRNNPIIQWNRNITMPIDMRDYIITSAKITAEFNGSADLNIETPTDTLDGEGGDAYAAEYDHVRFYVLISDLEKLEQYEIAYNQTVHLGRGDWGRTGVNGTSDASKINDTIMTMVDEDDLVFYLNRVLERDYRNFTITLGIDIYNEDNYENVERDTWYYLYIKSCNLTFNYTKKIDQFTSISWNQDGPKLSDLSPENYTVEATRANLKFQYKIDKNWTKYTSDQNSEINIYLNGIPYPIPIKLSDINTTAFEEASMELSHPSESVNLSIELLIREIFNLNQSISILIDNVSLYISYKIYTPSVAVAEGGNGGKTKVIRGPDYTPIIIALTAGIIGLVTVFGLYQARYKHPPMIRKIKKLKKKIKKGRKTKPLLLNRREELIKKSFKAQTHQILEIEKIQLNKSSKVVKTSKTDEQNSVQKEVNK